jgi:protein-S-isoprenylcysteine O-methyltransferase Ste14
MLSDLVLARSSPPFSAVDQAAGCLAYAVVALTHVWHYEVRPGYSTQGRDRQAARAWGLTAALVYVQISSLAVAVGQLFVAHPLWLSVGQSPWGLWAGAAVALAAVALYVTAKRQLADNYSHCTEPYLPHSVTERGLYGYVRHPIYSANLLLVAGLTVATGSLWLAANLGLLVVIYRRATRAEEAALRGRFAEYEQYQGRTGRFLPRMQLARTNRKICEKVYSP